MLHMVYNSYYNMIEAINFALLHNQKTITLKYNNEILKILKSNNSDLFLSKLIDRIQTW